MKTWRTEFGGEPHGYDPYNHQPARVSIDEVLAAMEKAWKDCLSNPFPIYAGSWIGDALYQHLATPDRGHEFLPYG